MNCKSCGANIKPGENFCGVCGTKVEVNSDNNNQVNNLNNNINQNYNNVNQNMNINSNVNNNQNNPITKEENTCTTLGLIGLITSFFINILSLPFSIIAVVKGAKLKKQTNKTQPGFIMGIIGIVLSIIIFLSFVFIVVLAVKEVNNLIDESKDNNYNYSEKEKYEDSMKVGNADVGYIYVPEDWKKFKDTSVNDENMIQYSDDEGDEIVTMTVFKNPTYTLEQYQESLKKLLEKDGNYIDEYDYYISNYEIKSKKIGGKYQGKYLYTWTFDDKDGNIHYIAIESSEEYDDVFDLIDTYEFNGSIMENTTY